jgi:transcription initiation factor TFIIH subunit 2
MESVEDVVLGEGVSASGAATEEELVALNDHSWLQWFQKSWLDIQEGGDGKLIRHEEPQTMTYGHNHKSNRIVDNRSGIAIKKGLIRFLYVIIDFSSSMKQTDYKPTRLDFVLAEVVKFVDSYFENNPLSYISLISMRNGTAHVITRINGQPNFQIKRLREYAQANQPSGVCSLEKAIDLVSRIGDPPMYGTKEVLVIWGSLVTVDNANAPINLGISQGSNSQGEFDLTVLSLSPELFAVKRIATRFMVAMNQTDFHEKLLSVLDPKPNNLAKPVYIKMGFPLKSTAATLTKCGCHFELHSALFCCPQCGCLVCEIPVNCPVCRISLVEKGMLTRIHRLLYEMPTYSETVADMRSCYGCLIPFNSDCLRASVKCNDCLEFFCEQCEVFLHNELRQCVGCLK